MHDGPVSHREWLFSIVIGVVFGCIALTKFSHTSFVVFCNVGQGDASLIHISPDIDIMIDAGKDLRALTCLSKYMKFGDKTIEGAFITHFQNDHYGGFSHILKRYNIDRLFISSKPPENAAVQTLMSNFRKSKTQLIPIYAGGQVELASQGRFTMLWPEKTYAETTAQSNDPNNLSQIMHFTFKDKRFLYTGDASPLILALILKHPLSKSDVLKIPHHGSKNGLIEEFLLLADPTYTVISSGMNNAYGHPSKEIIFMLEESHKQILRTDTLGDIIFSLE